MKALRYVVDGDQRADIDLAIRELLGNTVEDSWPIFITWNPDEEGVDPLK